MTDHLSEADRKLCEDLDDDVAHWEKLFARETWGAYQINHERAAERIRTLSAQLAKTEALAEQLAEALGEMVGAMEYWAGCDEGCTEDEATTEIMSAGGAYPSVAYEKARQALAAWNLHQIDGEG